MHAAAHDRELKLLMGCGGQQGADGLSVVHSPTTSVREKGGMLPLVVCVASWSGGVGAKRHQQPAWLKN